jgi:hypothetical protein
MLKQPFSVAYLGGVGNDDSGTRLAAIMKQVIHINILNP